MQRGVGPAGQRFNAPCRTRAARNSDLADNSRTYELTSCGRLVERDGALAEQHRRRLLFPRLVESARADPARSGDARRPSAKATAAGHCPGAPPPRPSAPPWRRCRARPPPSARASRPRSPDARAAKATARSIASPSRARNFCGTREASARRACSAAPSASCAPILAAARPIASSALILLVPSQSTPICASRTRRGFIQSSI